MKTLISLLFLSSALFYAACSNNSNSKKSSLKDTASDSKVANTNAANVEKSAWAISDVVSCYLKLKDALANDNGKEAASAAKEMNEAVSKTDESTLTPDQKKVYVDLAEDIREHTEHIGKNASDIEHQREHFGMLSQDMIDLVNAMGTPKILYKEFCPMYNDKKGASWLSESKEVKNPYYGHKMPECGEIKDEIKPKG